MSAFFVPYAAAALLLVVAGLPKVLDPRPTQRVASSTGLPAATGAVRLFGAAEALIGLLALTAGGAVPAALVALSYLGFAAFVGRGLVRGDLESCGCFNGDDSPPSLLHVVVDLGLALSAGAVAVSGSASGSVLTAHQSTTSALTLSLLSACVALLAYLVMARLPSTAPVVARGQA